MCKADPDTDMFISTPYRHSVLGAQSIDSDAKRLRGEIDSRCNAVTLLPVICLARDASEDLVQRNW